MTESEPPVFPFDTPAELDAEPEYAELRRENPVPKVRLAPGGEAYLASRYEDGTRVCCAGCPTCGRPWTSPRSSGSRDC
jgi:hypothetical protein